MAAAWRSPFRDEVLEVENGCCLVRGCLATTFPRLASPSLLQPDEDLMLDFAARVLKKASKDLALAISRMEAAELLALCGCGATPTQPVPSIGELTAGNAGVWLALWKLQAVKGLAQDAFDAVQRCRGHMWAATFMVRFPGVPGVNAFVEGQRLFAVGQLRAALHRTVEIAGLAAEATEAAFGVI